MLNLTQEEHVNVARLSATHRAAGPACVACGERWPCRTRVLIATYEKTQSEYADLMMVFSGASGFIEDLMSYVQSGKVRVCPRCGQDVRSGLSRCRNCSFDFSNVTTSPGRLNGSHG